MNSNKQKTIMDIPRFPAPECFRKDEKKTGNISNRVSVWVNFSVKNHKENEYFFSSRFARLAVSILSNSHDEFTEERSDPSESANDKSGKTIFRELEVAINLYSFLSVFLCQSVSYPCMQRKPFLVLAISIPKVPAQERTLMSLVPYIRCVGRLQQ